MKTLYIDELPAGVPDFVVILKGADARLFARPSLLPCN